MIAPHKSVLALLALAALACSTFTGPAAGPKPLTPTPSTGTQVAATEVADPAGPTEAVDAPATNSVEPTDTAEPTPAPVPAYLGDVVEQAGVSLAALQIADPAPPGSLFQPQAGQRLVAVEVVLGNAGPERLPAGPIALTLLDADGFTYSADLMAQDVAVLPSLTLEPGERVRGWAAFQVPEAAVLAALRVALPDSSATLQTNLAPRPDGAAPLSGTPYTSPDLPALGVATEAGGYALTAAALEDPAPAGLLYTPVEGRRLVAVELLLSNVSGPALTVSPLFAFLVDTDGYVYPGRLFGRDGTLAPVTLQPGDQARGWVSFELPAGAVPAAVRYTFDLFTGFSILTGLNAP